jgi:hypothetical protein
MNIGVDLGAADQVDVEERHRQQTRQRGGAHRVGIETDHEILLAPRGAEGVEHVVGDAGDRRARLFQRALDDVVGLVLFGVLNML